MITIEDSISELDETIHAMKGPIAPTGDTESSEDDENNKERELVIKDTMFYSGSMVYVRRLSKPIILAHNDYKGVEFLVISFGTHPCAYVRLKEEWGIGKFSDTEWERKRDAINCHGGISYDGGPPCTLRGDLAYDNTRWIGWDYHHSGDWVGPGGASNVGAIKWETRTIVEECLRVIEQLFALPGSYENINVLSHLRQLSKVELAKWLDNLYNCESPWLEWYSKRYCNKCPAANVNGINYSWCELHGKCRHFPEKDEVPTGAEMAEMWLDSEVNNME